MTMSANDVTEEMVYTVLEVASIRPSAWDVPRYKELIAAAINAVTPPDNDDPITPEWLDTVYSKCGPYWISPQTDDPTKPMLRILTPASIVMFPCQSVEWYSGISVSFETRGQLRAWHVAHRQPLKEVQS